MVQLCGRCPGREVLGAVAILKSALVKCDLSNVVSDVQVRELLELCDSAELIFSKVD
jgi:hypothetical protein